MDRCHFLLDISLTLTMVDWHWPVGCTPWTCSVWFASQIYRTSTGWWNDDTHLEPRSICVLSEAPTVESASMRKALGRLVSSEWSCRIALPVAGRTSLRDILVWLICEYGGKCDTCAWWTPSADQRSHNRPRDNCTECRERICGSHWNLEFSRSCLRWNRPSLREWFPLMSDLRLTFLYFFPSEIDLFKPDLLWLKIYWIVIFLQSSSRWSKFTYSTNTTCYRNNHRITTPCGGTYQHVTVTFKARYG